MSKRAWLVVISLLLVLAAGLRFFKLGSVPVGIYWDEVAMLVDAKSVSQTGHDMHGRVWYQVIYPSYGDFKLPVYIWLASASVSFFGVNPWALRLPSALAGLGTILVAGYCAYEAIQLESKKSSKRLAMLVAVSTMLIVAISPWDVMFSRTAFEGHVGQLLLALSAACLLASRRRWWLWYLSPIFGALATYTYFSVRFVWPVVFVALAIYCWWTAEAQLKTHPILPMIKKGALTLVLPLVLFIVLLIPMAKSPLYGDSNRFRLGTDSVLKNDAQIIQSNVYREEAGNTRIDRVVFHRWWLTARELMKNYSDNLSLNFLFTSGDPNLRHGTGEFGLFFWPLLPFFFWGWYQLFDKHRGLYIVLVLWWLAAALPASVPENTPHALRSLNALVPAAIAIGVGLGYVIERVVVAYKTKRRHQPVAFTSLVASGALAILSLCLIWSFTSFVHYYFVIYPETSAESWQQGYPEVAQSILKLREGGPVYVQPFDDKFYLWVMAYGPYTGNDFKSWQSFSYQFRSFDGINFTSFPGWGGVPNNDSRVVIAGKTTDIENLVATQPITVVKENVISDPAGIPKFKVILADKKL